MNTLIVHNQAEWDALPERFAEWTAIHIYSDPKVPLVIKKCPESSRAELRESSSAVLRESSSAVLRGSSSAVLRESSRAVLRGSSSGRAFANAVLQLFSDGATIEAWHSATIVCQDCKPTIKRHGTSVTVVRTKTFKHTIKSFCEIHGDGTKPLTLYKSVRPDTLCDHHTGAIKYEGIVECPDWDPNPKRQCGGGLHLSPTPHDALRYHDGTVLVCEVARKDIVVFSDDITKVRCRKVKVIGPWKEKQ